MERKIDSDGRLLLPTEYKNKLGINNGDPVEVTLVDGGLLVSKTIQMGCNKCLNNTVLSRYCPNCGRRLHGIL